MRTYGRIYDELGNYRWVQINTDANGFEDSVMLTTLCQVLQLNLGESPFFANYGIPQYQTVITQVYPDYYVMQTQQQFASLFASLTITRIPNVDSPQYNIRAVSHSGAILDASLSNSVPGQPISGTSTTEGYGSGGYGLGGYGE
jgi:hypothetical protein